MTRTLALALAAVCLFAMSSMVAAQKKARPNPNINVSKEYPNVIHSPSAESTPPVFRSVLQMEIVVKEGDAEPAIRYADGVVVRKDGLMACVLDSADSKLTEEDIRNRSRWDAYKIAYNEMIETCSPKHAPWHVIDANSKQEARIACFDQIIARFSQGLDIEPPDVSPMIRTYLKNA